jgi:hypothetical protein
MANQGPTVLAVSCWKFHKGVSLTNKTASLNVESMLTESIIISYSNSGINKCVTFVPYQHEPVLSSKSIAK